MTKHLKRIIAVLMIVIMAVAYVPVADIDNLFNIEASAIVSNGTVKLGDNIKWSYNNKTRTITISGSGAMYNFSNGDSGQRWDELVVGLTHYPNKDARTIVIGNGITSIGNNVFNGLNAITSVTIPASVTTIGDNAFRNCSALTSITIPAAVTTIGKSAFEGCSKLATVTLNNGLKTIGDYAFKSTAYKSVSLPYTVTSVGSYAFANISGVKLTCAYDDAGYRYCTNSKHITAYALKTPALAIDTALDTAKKEIVVTLKVNNAAGLNAANFVLTYNNGATPVSTDTSCGDMTENINTAIVYPSSGKISIGVVAKNNVPFKADTQTIAHEIAKIRFKINESLDTADFNLSATTFMIDNTRMSVSAVKKTADLHNYVRTGAVAATCKSTGSVSYKCSICNKTKTETVAKNPSNHTGKAEIRNKVAATCEKAGFTGNKVCTSCNAVLEKGKDIAALGHKFAAAETKNSTCKDKGYTRYVCSVCKTSKNEYKDLVDHTYVAVETKKGSCTEKGYTRYECSVCKDSKTEYTEQVEHSYVLVETVEGNCKKDGYEKYECSVCKATDERYTDSSDKHNYEVVKTVEGDCQNKGYTRYKCADCRKKETVYNDEYSDHKFESIFITEATCVSAGEKMNICTVCDYKETEIVPATGHSNVEEVVNPTCEVSGYTLTTCSVCNSSQMTNVVPGLGHEFGKDGKCIRCDATNITEIVFVQNTYIEVTNITIMADGADSGAAAETVLNIVKSKSDKLTAAEILKDIEGEGWIVVNADGETVADDALITTDCSIRLTGNDSIEYKVVITGDVNADGKVTASDARLVLRTAASLDNLTEVKSLAADIDANSKVVASDARKILRASAQVEGF